MKSNGLVGNEAASGTAPLPHYPHSILPPSRLPLCAAILPRLKSNQRRRSPRSREWHITPSLTTLTPSFPPSQLPLLAAILPDSNCIEGAPLHPCTCASTSFPIPSFSPHNCPYVQPSCRLEPSWVTASGTLKGVRLIPAPAPHPRPLTHAPPMLSHLPLCSHPARLEPHRRRRVAHDHSLHLQRGRTWLRALCRRVRMCDFLV